MMKFYKLITSLLLPLLVLIITLTPSSRAQGIILDFVEAYYDGTGLDGATSVSVSPDKNYVYVAGFDDDAVAVFSRDTVTGQLTFVEMLQDNVGIVDGLDGPRSVSVSPDNNYVYVAGYNDNAVAVFSRDTMTGRLTFVEILQDGVGGVDGLAGILSVSVSPDNNHVYATGSYDDAVAVFSRDTMTGRLTFVEILQDGVDGVDGLNGAWSVSVSPDNNHVYVTGAFDNAVAVFSRNTVTGQLTFVEMLQDGVSGVNGLAMVWSVTVSPDNNHVYVAGYNDNAVAVFSRNPSTGQLTFVEMLQDGVGGVDGLFRPRSVTASPDNNHVYVAGLDDAVVVFSRNTSTGQLTFVEMLRNGIDGVDGLTWATSVIVSPDNNHVYVTGDYDDTVAAFSRNTSTGQLTFVEMLQDGVGGVNGLYEANSVTISPDNSCVYVTGSDNAVAVFSRNTVTGQLTFVEMLQDGVGGVDGLDGANSVAVSPDNNYVYVVSSGDDAVAVFSRDTATDQLTFVEMLQDGVDDVDGLDGATSVTVSPDNNHVYVVSSGDDAVAVFSRNTSTGQLTFVEMLQDGIDSVDGLHGINSVAVSPDNNYIYVAVSDDDAVVVFSRNTSTGQLTFVEMLQDGVDGVDGLDGAISVSVSPDNNYVYAVGAIDNAVVVFSRNASTGQLTFVEMLQDGAGDVNGLGAPTSVRVSPDNNYVYAVSFYDDAVVVFSRNTSTGQLMFVEMFEDDVGGEGLDGARSISVSPDNNHVYVTSIYDNAVVAFAVIGGSDKLYLPLIIKN